MSKKKMTVVEIVVAAIILGILLVIFLPCPPWSKKFHSARRHACVNNLKQLWLMLNLYAM